MDKPVTQRAQVMVGTIGTFRMASENGDDLTPRGRKSRALAAILAIERRALARERLADLLWSNRETDQSRSSLRQALFEIRHASDYHSGIVVEGRDGLSLNPSLARSDLQWLESAAASNDWAQLLRLLDGCGPELLEDLDGIDPEFDNWLRNMRASEPGHTLSLVLDSAQRCLTAGNARQAADIAAQLIRLDPPSEAASRLAMAAAYQQGDRASVNRLFKKLEAKLADDFGTTPSQETRDLFRLLNAPDPAVTEAARLEIDLAAAPPPPPVDGAGPIAGDRRRRTAAWMTAGGFAGAVLLSINPRPADTPPVSAAPLVAVVPFEEVPHSDGALAEGLWDDTRTALLRTGAVRILGRTTSEAFSRQRLTPADYRNKLGVDYLLDGSIRRDGERVRVTVSLLRTADGVAIWGRAFDGRLGDSIALQGSIATAIEGRIRGRLAEGGGAVATQIPTTSEVYGLYSQARTLVRTRLCIKALQASKLLDRAIDLDPNFAPAHALSGAALYYASFDKDHDPNWRAKAKYRTERAIELAPKLGQAYAASALVEGLNSPASTAKLIKATTLDPSDSDAWVLLSYARANKGDGPGAKKALQQAIEIDPFFMPAVSFLASMQMDQDDRSGLARLTSKLGKADSSGMMLAGLRAQQAYRTGHISAGLKPLLPFAARPDISDYAQIWLAEGLMTLGYWDEIGRMFGLGRKQVDLMAGRDLPDLARIDRDFFFDKPSMTAHSRTALNRGRGKLIVDAYHRYFSSTDDYIREASLNGELLNYLPYLAVALRQAGYRLEATKILGAADLNLRGQRQQDPVNPYDMMSLARVRAAQGRNGEALRLVKKVVALGWLPDGYNIPTDLAQDPAFRLADGPQFRALRATVLANVARERRELGPVHL